MSKTYRVKVKEVPNAPEGYSRTVNIIYKGSPKDTLVLDSEQYDYEYEVSDGAEFRVDCTGSKSVVITVKTNQQNGMIAQSKMVAIYAPKAVEPKPEPVVPVEPEPEPEVPDSDDSDSNDFFKRVG